MQHPIAPTYDASSSILILGSFPSVKSRETGYFYGHPQNRFWRVLAAIFSSEEEGKRSGLQLPSSTEDKKSFLLRNHIAVWDVIASCDITGSSDSSIRNVIPNDISLVLTAAPIEKLFTNGKKAQELYNKYLLPVTGRDAVCLPSTSPANATWTFQKLCQEWKEKILG